MAQDRFRGRIYEDITQTIGHTPLVRLHRLVADGAASVVAKLESFNPLWSVKDRLGVALIDAAERDGKIDKDTVIIEPTSGNTGIGLAFTCAARGYKLIVTLPETMSLERRRLLKAFGAEVVLTPGDKGMNGAVARAEELAKATPQFVHSAAIQEPGEPGDPSSHHGRGDLGRYGWQSGHPGFGRRHRRHDHRRREVIKKRKPQFKAIAVEPVASPVITQKGKARKSGRAATRFKVSAPGSFPVS